jgi:hypothetical protein
MSLETLDLSSEVSSMMNTEAAAEAAVEAEAATEAEAEAAKTEGQINSMKSGVMFHKCLTPKSVTSRSYMQQK